MTDKDIKRKKFDDCNARAKLFFQKNEYSEAIAEWTVCIDLHPGDYLIYSNRSAAYLKNNDPSMALRDADVVIKMQPAFAKGWHRKGAALETLQRYRDAVSVYAKAIELDGGTNPSYTEDYQRVKALADSGRGVADDATRTAFYVQQHQTKAKAAFDEGEFLAAVRLYTKAIELDEKNHVLYSNRSAAYLKAGKHAEALADGKHCLVLCPSYAKGHARIGNALVAQGKLAEAKGAFERGLGLESGNSACAEGLAVVERTVAEQRAKDELWEAQKKVQQEEALLAAQNPETAPLPINTGAHAVCYKCGQIGHEAPQCVKAPVFDKGHAVGYDYCKLCNKIGHKARNCPDRLFTAAPQKRGPS